MNLTRRFLLKLTPFLLWRGSTLSFAAAEAARPYGEAYPQLDSLAVGEWWNAKVPSAKKAALPPAMNVPRDEVAAFALYTHENSVLKLTAQFFPLKPDEARQARLEFKRDGAWVEVATAAILYPGWSAHFRIGKWDATQNVAYRVRHGDKAMFEGLIRRDPIDKNEIVIANMSCNSSRTGGMRPEIVEHLRAQDPDLLFFAGDQTYRHTEHTAGWIEFGLQFRDVMRDRPTICIPDDHDVGQPNLWGENGKQCLREDGSDGGFLYPPEYVNQVQRQQAWNLPDAVDPAPVERGITVYFTRLRVGGVDFAILEDRKFKSGPFGKIPVMGPRPDHINDPTYDPNTVDLSGLQLLGERQKKFLRDWGQDWSGCEMKAVLSATSFCGAVHMHGKKDERLLADLDCNGWPQTPRNRALEEIRRAWAVHLCGDQHLAVVTKQGIREHGDGPYSFTSPALVNTTYGRWWHPLDEKSGPNPVPNSPLPWTGDFKDGLGNKLSMLAYANPPDINDERQRADGYGIARFDKKTRQITFECWPRFFDAKAAEKAQFPGWPITVSMEKNDGREVLGWLPELVFENGANPVVQVVEDSTGDILYTVRAQGGRFHPRVYSLGKHAIKIGADKPDAQTLAALDPKPKAESGQRNVKV